MGVHFNFSLQVGFRFDQEAIHSHFRKVIPGVFHMEDRYDTVTGKMTGQVRVFDTRQSSVIIIDGEEMDEDSDAVSKALAELLDCNVEIGGSYSSGDLEYFFSAKSRFGPSETLDYGHISVSNPSVLYSEVLDMKNPLEKLEKALKALGIKPRQPCVYIGSSIG